MLVKEIKMKLDHKKIKILRIQKKLSLDDLAFELRRKLEFRVTKQTLHNWESGNTQPKADDIGALAQYFCKPITYFYV